MNSIGTLIKKHYPNVSDAQRREITISSLGYVLNLVNSREFTAFIRDIFTQNVNVIDFRRDLQAGYYLRNLKLWLWYCWSTKLTFDTASSISCHFKVLEQDVILFHVLLSNTNHHDKLNTFTSLYRCHKPKVYDKHLTDVLQQLHGYTNRFIWAKLRFLTMGSETTVDDLFMELQYYALYAIMRQYPKVESKLHLVNIAKRAIHNFGINIIHHNTTRGRAVWDYNEEGQALNLIKSSYNMMFDSSAYKTQAVSSINGSTEEPYEDEQDKLNLKLSVLKVVNAQQGKRRRLLELLTGTYDVNFSSYLKGQGLKDNDEFFDFLERKDKLDTYIEHISNFLGVSTYKTHVFLNTVRDQL